MRWAHDIPHVLTACACRYEKGEDEGLGETGVEGGGAYGDDEVQASGKKIIEDEQYRFN